MRELSLKDKDETKNNDEKEKFELKVLFGSQKLIYTNDSLQKEQADKIIKEIISVLNKQK